MRDERTEAQRLQEEFAQEEFARHPRAIMYVLVASFLAIFTIAFYLAISELAIVQRGWAVSITFLLAALTGLLFYAGFSDLSSRSASTLDEQQIRLLKRFELFCAERRLKRAGGAGLALTFGGLVLGFLFPDPVWGALLPGGLALLWLCQSVYYPSYRRMSAVEDL